MKKILLFFASLLIVPSFVFSTTEYVPKSIPGGWVRRIVEAPSAPGTFYAVSYGVFKSIDGGQTWVRKSSVQPSNSVITASTGTIYGNHHTGSVAVSPSNANLVVVADEGWSPIWRSDDGGDTWTCIPFQATGDKGMRAVLVTSSLYNGNYFFAPIEESIGGKAETEIASVLNMSTDGGLTWLPTGLTTTASESITDVIQIPSGANAGRIVVSVVETWISFNRDNQNCPTTGKIYYSDNITNGSSFTQAASFTTPAYKMTWDSTNNKIWMITSKGEIYNSTDSINWSTMISSVPFNTTSTGHRPTGILYSTTTPSSIMAFGNTDSSPGVIIYRSSDSAGGFPSNSWKNITLPNAVGKEKISQVCNDLVVDSRYSDGSRWGIAESEMGFYYTTSTALGVTTSGDFSSQRGISTPDLTFGIKDPSTNRLYVAAGHAVYYSPDNGESWSRVYPQLGMDGDPVGYLSFLPGNTSKVFMMANQLKIYYTNDNGADHFNNVLVDFTAAPYSFNMFTQHPTNLIINPSNPAIMFIGIANSSTVTTTDNYLYKSVDSGTSWSKVSSFPNTHGVSYLAIHPTNPEIIYAACSDQSVAGGNYTGHGDGLYKSTDTGNTWTNIGFADARISMISIDPATPDNMIVGYQNATSGGSAISLDGGNTWENLTYSDYDVNKTSNTETTAPTDNGELDIKSKKIMPRTDYGNLLYSGLTFIADGLIYSGTNSGTVYMSSDLGVTPLKPVAVLPTAITWLFKGSVLATSGSGLYDLTFTTGTNTTTTTYATYSGNELKVYNYPNPFNPNINGHTTIKLSISRATKKLKLNIYSLSGDLLVDSSFNNVVGGFSYNVEWDGKNDKGELCAPGLYFIIVDADGTKAKHKIVIIR
ncbi:MAG: T9SS type A sorting domain-containing protein [Elusimicrobia bacterium]|nr:T9SS type A sorting domain-containing protein [Elusimicrobiota bacterium]